MSDYVWVSTMMLDSALIKLFDADIVEENRPVAVAATDAIPRGEPVSADKCPRYVWARKGSSKVKDSSLPPPLFVARGYWIVNSAAADVLRQFDLGAGALYPVEVRKSDAITPFEGGWYTWIFGNQKETANFEASIGLRQFSPRPDSPRRALPFKPADGDLAVSHKALEGADVWVEKNLFQSVFVSAALGNALKSAGLARAFRLAKARVV
jgi:hypothetical protein